ncbi:spore germination protein GerPC [Falsibacillus pallidus]|uniref:spore germination protein GerPC n=1 Tax=Falsibacillus pallidus TaxID=493781 RepID=UPI003D961E64
MQDLYYYINQLYSFIKQQNKRMEGLESSIKDLQNEIEALKNRPSINVERLEYKFDQLKVETLEGTLNIGLNPSDIDKIEDFAVEQQTSATNSHTSMSQLPEGFRENVAESSNKYIEQELPTLIVDTEDQLQVKLDPQYHTMIIEDIKRQLPQRISYYINTLSGQYNRSSEEASLDEIIFSRIKADIQQAVYTFIAQLPNELKGKNDDGT